MMNLIEIGRNIKTAREKYLPGISLNRAATMAMLSYTQLKNIESGIYNARVLTLLQIADRWDIPLEEIFCPNIKEVKKEEPKKKSPIGR